MPRCLARPGCSTPTRGSITPRDHRVRRAVSRPPCPTSSTRCSSSTRGPRPSISRSVSPWPPPVGRTSSRWPRPTTAGRTRAMRSRPRSPTIPYALETRRSGCTRSTRRMRTAVVIAARMPHATRPRRRRSCARSPPRGTPPAAFLSETFYGNAGGVALRTATCARCTRRPRPRRSRGRRRGAGGFRAARFMVLGLPAAGGRARQSWRWRSPSEGVSRSALSSRGARSPTATARRDTSSPRPGVLRCRPSSARRCWTSSRTRGCKRTRASSAPT